jgi:hypothetical protein
VSYAPGWNIVAAPGGETINGASGPLYTLRGGDASYESIQNGAAVNSGQGYWAYFPSSTTDVVPVTTVGSLTLTVPLPAGVWVLLGNPSAAPAGVSGADGLEVWDPAGGSWSQASTLAPGQGGFATSYGGGQATITTHTSP